MPVPSVRVPAARRSLFAPLVAALIALACLAPAKASAAWSTNGNSIWQSSQSTNNTTEVRVAPDNAGGSFVAFVEYQSGQPRIFLQRVTGTGAIASGWTAGGMLVCTAANSRGELQMIADGSGGVYLGWVDFRSASNNPDIYLQHVLSNGTLASGNWVAGGNAIRVHSAWEGYPRLALDGSGGVVVAWKTTTSQLMVERVDASGNQLWTPGGRQFVTYADFNDSIDLIGDGAGGGFVSWNDSNGTLYANRILGPGGDPGWSPVPHVNSTGTGKQPAITSDGNGGMFVAYRWSPPFSSLDQVNIQRVNGLTNWSGNGFVACSATGDQHDLRAVSDGCSNAIVGWLDDRTGQGVGDVYAIKVQFNGSLSPGWTSGGIAVRTTSVSVGKSNFSMNGDGRGGAVLAWGENTTEVRAHHLHSQGGLDPLIPSGGKVLRASSVSGFATPTRAALATFGGEIAAWQDTRNSLPAIYANRMDFTVPTLATLTLPEVARYSIKAWWMGPVDADKGAPISFDLRRSLSPITEANFNGAILVTGSFSATHPDDPYCFEVDGLQQCKLHYMALKTTYACGDVYSFASASTTCSGFTMVLCDGPMAQAPPAADVEAVNRPFMVDTPFPNPAGAIATLGFDVPQMEVGRTLDVSIFDLGGRRVKLLSNGPAAYGRHRLEWDLRGESGDRVRAGLYFARFTIGETRVTKPVLVR